MKDGAPVEWFTNIKRNHSHLLNDFVNFTKAFHTHFGTSDIEGTYLRKLESLRQTGSAAQYIARFHEYSAHLDLSEQTKLVMFKKGLKDATRAALVNTKLPDTLELFEPLVILIDNNLHELDLERKNKNSKTSIIPNHQRSKSSVPTPSRPLIPGTETVPMEVDAIKQVTKLTVEERKRRIDNDLCLYCGQPLHRADNCPTKAANAAKKAQATSK